jgi:hypothetical protein
VAVVAAPAPAVWHGAAGIALVGPRAFGYDGDNLGVSAERVRQIEKASLGKLRETLAV